MPDFVCYFLDKDVENNPSVDAYRNYFLAYDPRDWLSGAGDGVFDAGFENGDNATLYVLDGQGFGISVRYNLRKGHEKHGQEFYSIRDRNRINKIVDVGDDQFAPIGSFLKPEKAWLAVEDFFKNPKQKSSRIEWISSDQIDWPDL